MASSIPPRPLMWAPPPPRQRRRWSTWAWTTILIAYLLIIAAATLVGTVLSDIIMPVIDEISRHVSWLTFRRLEYVANIVLFIPFGFILSFLFSRAAYLVFPAAFVTTVAIESIQALALFDRVPTTTDVIANAAGACIGILIAAPALRRRREESANGSRCASPSSDRPREPNLDALTR